MIKPLLFKKQAPDLATSESITTLEAKLDFRLPAAFAEFCMRWNGGFPSKDNQFYPVPMMFKEFYEEFGSRPGGVLIDTLFGASEKFPQCNVLDEYNLISKNLSRELIPIAVNLFGDRAVLLRSDSSPEIIYWWDHELWEMPHVPNPLGNAAERPRLIPIAQNLEHFYNSLTANPFRR